MTPSCARNAGCGAVEASRNSCVAWCILRISSSSFSSAFSHSNALIRPRRKTQPKRRSLCLFSSWVFTSFLPPLVL
jgi:hypothetical protein